METLADILTGPCEERSHASARARTPMTEAEARHVLRDLEAHTRSRAARIRLVQLAIGPAGNLTDAARDLYRRYLAILTRQ